MLNGKRHLWTTKIERWTDKRVGLLYHRVCPSYKHFSAITNNGFVGISWFMTIPTALLVTSGILLTVFITWILGLVFFLAAPAPWLWVIKRYLDSTPCRWEEGNKIAVAENAYLMMPKAKQKEYRPFIDAVFRGNLPPNDAKKLFEMCSSVDSIRDKLRAEFEQQKQLQAIMEEINESS